MNNNLFGIIVLILITGYYKNVKPVLLMIVVFTMLYFSPMYIFEHQTNIDSEAIKNISSIYNKEDMIVTNLTVTNSIKIGPKDKPNTSISANGIINTQNIKTNNITAVNANIGQWNIRDNNIGIPSYGDLNFSSDGYIRLLEYDSNNTSKYTASGGFASTNLYAVNTVNAYDITDHKGVHYVKYGNKMSIKRTPMAGRNCTDANANLFLCNVGSSGACGVANWCSSTDAKNGTANLTIDVPISGI